MHKRKHNPRIIVAPTRKATHIFAVCLVLAVTIGGYFAYTTYHSLTSKASGCVAEEYTEGAVNMCIQYAQEMLNGITYDDTIKTSSTNDEPDSKVQNTDELEIEQDSTDSPVKTDSVSSSHIETTGRFDTATVENLNALLTDKNMVANSTLDAASWPVLCTATQQAYARYPASALPDQIVTAHTASVKAGCENSSADNTSSPQTTATDTTDTDSTDTDSTDTGNTNDEATGEDDTTTQTDDDDATAEDDDTAAQEDGSNDEATDEPDTHEDTSDKTQSDETRSTNSQMPLQNWSFVRSIRELISSFFRLGQL